MRFAKLSFVLAIGVMACAFPCAAQPSARQSGLVIDSSQLVVSEGEVTERGVLLSMPVRYARTGRLANQVSSRVRINFGTKDIPAGTPVFAQQFEDLGVLWCAVHDWVGGLRSVCFQTLPSGSARADIGSPYAAPLLAPDTAIQEPAVVVEDQEAVGGFPPMEMVYVLDEWRRREIRIWRALRVNGEIYRQDLILFDRQSDGATQFRVGRHIVRVSPSGEENARVSLLQ